MAMVLTAKKKKKRAKKNEKQLPVCLEKNIMKGFGVTVAISTLARHLWSESSGHGCKPKDHFSSLKCC